MSLSFEYQTQYEYSSRFARKAYLLSLRHDYKGAVVASAGMAAVGLWERGCGAACRRPALADRTTL
jgi:hypothetical protein